MANSAKPIKIFKHEAVRIADLKPHPQNYREHSEDQINHLVSSIREHGFYRNVVIANDGTILAGHGVVEACRILKKRAIPVVRLRVGPDDPKALKVLTGDNEIGRLAGVDDRALSELLKKIKDEDVDGLLGTGYDEQRLAALAFVTRPQSEIKDFNKAAEWAGAGMPEFGDNENPLKLTILFRNEEDRTRFAEELLGPEQSWTEKTRSVWWPMRSQEDSASVKFEG